MRGDDIVGRLGGEEFAAILPGGIETATMVAERVRVAFETAGVTISGHCMNATVSIGAADCMAGAADIKALLTRADSALYQAKSSGRNRVMAEHAITPRGVPAPALVPVVNSPSLIPQSMPAVHFDRQLSAALS
jgi:PleD family two-component response regulator